MRTRIRLLTIGALLPLIVHAPNAGAQALYEDTTEWVFGLSGWAIDLHGGLSTYGRFLLEAPDIDRTDRIQREVTAGTGFSFGAGVAATILPRTQTRLSYTHASSDLNYRDDSGNGDSEFDLDDIGGLSSDIIALELTRYLVKQTSAVVPYANAGLVGTFWKLDNGADLVRAPGGSRQFRWGATGSLGVQFAVARAFRVRLEAATTSVGNPFSGSESFVTLDGFTIDEPTRVTRRDYRIVLAYVFGGSDRSTETTTATKQ